MVIQVNSQEVHQQEVVVVIDQQKIITMKKCFCNISYEVYIFHQQKYAIQLNYSYSTHLRMKSCNFSLIQD